MIQIIDDAIPVAQQDAIENLCSSVEFPWYYHNSTAYHQDDLVKYNFSKDFFKDALEGPFFAHMLCTAEGPSSYFFEMFRPLFFAMPDVENQYLVRLKANLTYPVNKSTQNTHSAPHVDLADDIDYCTAIYYINDSDGDTFIFNEQWPYNGAVTLKQRITPKKGRLVIFNGRYLHAGNNPTTGVRMVANINTISRSMKDELVPELTRKYGS